MGHAVNHGHRPSIKLLDVHQTGTIEEAHSVIAALRFHRCNALHQVVFGSRQDHTEMWNPICKDLVNRNHALTASTLDKAVQSTQEEEMDIRSLTAWALDEGLGVEEDTFHLSHQRGLLKLIIGEVPHLHHLHNHTIL